MWRRLVRTVWQYFQTTVSVPFRVIVPKTNQLTCHSCWRPVHLAAVLCGKLPLNSPSVQSDRRLVTNVEKNRIAEWLYCLPFTCPSFYCLNMKHQLNVISPHLTCGMVTMQSGWTSRPPQSERPKPKPPEWLGALNSEAWVTAKVKTLTCEYLLK